MTKPNKTFYSKHLENLPSTRWTKYNWGRCFFSYEGTPLWHIWPNNNNICQALWVYHHNQVSWTSINWFCSTLLSLWMCIMYRKGNDNAIFDFMTNENCNNYSYLPGHTTPTSSTCPQLWTPQPICRHWTKSLVLQQSTSSNHIGPVPSPKVAQHVYTAPTLKRKGKFISVPFTFNVKQYKFISIYDLTNARSRRHVSFTEFC